MNTKELLELGFVDLSDVIDGYVFSEYSFQNENIHIEITGISRVEIKILNIDKKYTDWIDVPNCKTISDIKNLIKMFTK